MTDQSYADLTVEIVPVSDRPAKKTEKKPAAKKRVRLAEYEELLTKAFVTRKSVSAAELAWIEKTLFEKLS